MSRPETAAAQAAPAAQTVSPQKVSAPAKAAAPRKGSARKTSHKKVQARTRHQRRRNQRRQRTELSRSGAAAHICAMSACRRAVRRPAAIWLAWAGPRSPRKWPGCGAETFRAGQLWHWIYHRGVTDFAAMTNLAKPFRELLAERYELRRPEIATARISIDGTRKWLLRFDDGQEAETVHIPESDRGTLCVSSQVGCTLTCRFCHTGTQRLVRNLSAAEIVGQVMIARDALGEWPSPKEDRQLTNIVLMGMGEPLYNYENVAAALKIVMDPEGLAISRRKITLSTAGVVPMIARVGAELGVNLAVSLHAVTDELRDRARAAQPQIPDRRAAGGVPDLSRIEQRAAHHVRIRDAEGDQRQPGRGARTGASA